MRKNFADYNARTESGHIRLGCEGSREDLRESGIEVGDWAWLSDGELVVGAQIASDDRYGIVGVPRWKTLVHLDDDDSEDFSANWDEFLRLHRQFDPDSNGETGVTRVFQLMTILEPIAPESIKSSLAPGYFPFRRALALLLLDEPALALVELREALEARPNDPDLGHLYLEILRTTDPGRAAVEALRAEHAGAGAPVLAACINIWADAADRAPDGKFEDAGLQILDRIVRFDRAPGRDEVRARILAQVRFNQGLTLLRLGRFEEARAALHLAHAINPNDSAIEEALQLEVFDERAREIAAVVRERHVQIAA